MLWSMIMFGFIDLFFDDKLIWFSNRYFVWYIRGKTMGILRIGLIVKVFEEGWG